MLLVSSLANNDILFAGARDLAGAIEKNHGLRTLE